MDQHFRSYQLHTIYSPYIVILVKKHLRNEIFFNNEIFLRITVSDFLTAPIGDLKPHGCLQWTGSELELSSLQSSTCRKSPCVGTLGGKPCNTDPHHSELPAGSMVCSICKARRIAYWNGPIQSMPRTHPGLWRKIFPVPLKILK